MIFVKVRNFRGCERADITVDPIALLAGPNAAGKSSVAQAVGATLCGQANAGLIGGRDSPGMLVRTGASDALVEITSDGGSTVAMSWPSGRARTDGEHPLSSSVYAAGLSSLVNLTPRERSRVLAEYLKADPTLDDLIAACREEGWDEATATMVWERVQQHTWDGFYKLRQERGAELKGEWRGITGQVYGSRVGAGWRPDLEGLDLFELEGAAARATMLVENAVAAAAVSQAARDLLIAEAAALEDRRQALQRAEATVEECGNRLRETQLARHALPPAERLQAIPCPHCRELVVVSQPDLGGLPTLEKAPDSLKDSEVKTRRLAIAGADGAVGNAQDAVNRARRDQTMAAAAVEESEKAAARLRDWPRAVETGTDIEAAREAARTAESQLADFKKKQEADKRHREIENNEKLLGLLAPTGLRAKKLARVVDVFFGEGGLRGLTDAAGWEPVTVDDDTSTFRLGGRPYALLSTSEQYRVRAILAIGMAKLDQSDLVVLDAADVLDARTRSGLMAVLDEAGIPALVGMTLSRPEQIPEPAREFSYWIANGIVEPIADRAEAA